MRQLTVGVLVFLYSVFFVACGSAQKLDRNRVEKVQKVAIIGFGLQHMRPNTGKDVVSALLGGEDDRFSGAEIAVPSKLAEQMYMELASNLAKQTGWKVIDYTTLKNHPAYRAFYKRHTKQPQLRPLVKSHVEAYIPEGIVEGFLLGRLDEKERASLMRELGVDGAVIVTVNSDLVNDANVFQKLAFQGKFRRLVGTRFAVFDVHGEDPIWFDGKTRAESEEGAKHGLGFSDVEKLNKISLQTAKQVFSKIGEGYKTL